MHKCDAGRSCELQRKVNICLNPLLSATGSNINVLSRIGTSQTNTL